MKILVAVKRVVDFKATVRVKADGTDVETANVKMSMNPFDEIAVEEAVRLKEKGIAKEIVVATIGLPAGQEVLRTAFALGADRGVLVQTEAEMQPLAVAKILQAVVLRENPTLVILGKQAIDTDDNQVGQMLAGLLNWGQGTFASQLVFHEQAVSVTREIDGGLETLSLTLPAVITTDLRLNEPRYLSLPNIVKAKSKPIEVIPVADLSLSLTSTMHLLSVASPEKGRAGTKVETAAQLVTCLKNEAHVLG